MPRASQFNQYPPFPEDVALADVPRLSLSKLLENDILESERLFRACREIGFFLLDLTGSRAGESMLDDTEKVFDLGQKIFGLGQEELMKTSTVPKEGLHFGYKHVGSSKLEDGSLDSVEWYNVGQDEMLSNSVPRPHQDIVMANRNVFKEMFYDAYGIICHVLSHLDQHLSLKPGTLASLNPQDKPSATMIRMLKCPPQDIGSHRTNLFGHTDLGSMTMLFNILGGLQILPPAAENVDEKWLYIRPEPGCAVINIGDAMTQWSGGILRSSMHRIATPPGLQAGCPRYSVGYFLRAEASASMRRLQEGDVIPRLAEGEEENSLCARDWEQSRDLLVKAVPAPLDN